MPTIKQSLPAGDLNYYRVIAMFWGFELNYPEPERALSELVENMCDIEHLSGVIDGLDEHSLEGINELVSRGGKMPLNQFTRKFGELREVGAGKRDRERLYDSPISATEVLFYRGLIGKGYLKQDVDQTEQIFLPDEIMEGLELLGYEPAELSSFTADQQIADMAPDVYVGTQYPGRSATAAEYSWIQPRELDILNDLTTVICSLRNQQSYPNLVINQVEAEGLLRGLGILQVDNNLDTEKVKRFLELDREQALSWLISSWLESRSFDEMRNLPDIEIEGYLVNQPEKSRSFVLEHLSKVPPGKWWNLNSFIKYIKDKDPDFQRPAGNYEVWLLKSRTTGVYLKGYRHWDEVEGRQIEYQLIRPMFWFGMLDLACPEEGSKPLAFRVLPKGLSMLKEDGSLSASNDGQIVATRDVPRVVRYHLSRFCESPRITRESYIYKVTHSSLSRAREQGLTVDHLLSLLKKNSNQPIPPLFQKSVERWQKNGIEASFKDVVVLKVKNPSVIAELKKTNAARFIREELNTTTVVIPKDAREKVRQALMSIGVITEDGFIG